MIQRVVIIYVGLLVVMTCLSIAIALPGIFPSSLSVNESISIFYNITVNNSEVGSVNITQVNITLPAGFRFAALSNGSSSSGSDFSNTTNVLNWNKTDFLIQNVTNQSFWFNATANTTTIGTFNFSVALLNDTGVINYNVSITVNDTSIPSNVSFVSPSPVNHTNSSSTSITINVSALDNGPVSNVTIFMYNVTNHLANTANLTAAPFNSTFTLANGNYTFNATVIDASSRTNYTQTRRLIIDNVDPSISTITLSSNTETSITIAYNCTDSGSGVKTCVITGASGSGESISGNTVSSLECGESYSITVTATDHAGNDDSEAEVFETDACTDDSASSNGGGGGASDSDENTSVAWTASYSVSAAEFKEGYNRELGVKHRLRFNVGTEQHSVGVVALTTTKATINVSSTPQQAVFNKGDSKKFDVDADNFYDVLVTLNSIASSKANVTIVAIAEEIPEKDRISATSTTAKKNTTVNGTTQKASAPEGESKFTMTTRTYFIGGAAILLGALIILYVIGKERRWFDFIPFLQRVP